MKYYAILITLFLVVGCQKAHYVAGTDFVRNYNALDDVTLLKTNDIIYIVELDTANIVFLNEDGPLNSSKREDQKSLQEYYDWFDMEESNKYGYSNPKEFFATEYNKNFKAGLLSDRKKRITVKNFQWVDIIE